RSERRRVLGVRWAMMGQAEACPCWFLSCRRLGDGGVYGRRYFVAVGVANAEAGGGIQCFLSQPQRFEHGRSGGHNRGICPCVGLPFELDNALRRIGRWPISNDFNVGEYVKNSPRAGGVLGVGHKLIPFK